MEGSLLRVLQLPQKERDCAVAVLARAIELAPATARRCLDMLQRDGLVAFTTARKRTRRPEYSFDLKVEGNETLPKGYKRLLWKIIGGPRGAPSYLQQSIGAPPLHTVLIQR